MYAYIKGILIESNGHSAIVEVHGIGYKIFVPADCLGKLSQQGKEVTLHTSLVIRENSQALYGFSTANNRDLFEALLNVSGIGPKIALSISGHMPAHELQAAIRHNNIQALTKIPGIGKKTAERLIIEMRDKMDAYTHHSAEEYALSVPDSQARMIADAMNALINLGYNQLAAQKALKKTIQEYPEEIDLPTLITQALKKI